MGRHRARLPSKICWSPVHSLSAIGAEYWTVSEWVRDGCCGGTLWMGHGVTNHRGHWSYQRAGLGRDPQNPTHGHSIAILGSSDLHGDSWRRVGREGKHLQTQTAPRILAGHRQLLALCLFIPDLRCPFYFSPF